MSNIKQTSNQSEDNLNIISNALSGTTGGALLGSTFGIVGSVLGGIVGGIITGYSGYQNRLQKRHTEKSDLAYNNR